MNRKTAPLPASESAEAHCIIGVSEPESAASRGCAGDVQFLPGTRFKLGELIVELSHCLSMDRLVVRELESGCTRVVTRADLRPIERPRSLENAASRRPALENITEAQLEQLKVREEALQPYLDGKELSAIEAHRLDTMIHLVTSRNSPHTRTFEPRHLTIFDIIYIMRSHYP